MFISNSRQFIFIHLHKCAGTSIEVALSRTLAWNDLLLGSTVQGERLQKIYEPMFGMYKHSTAARVREVIGAELWDRYYSFSTVRNPFAVAVSQYRFSLHHMADGLRRIARQRAAGETGPIRLPVKEWPWSYPGVKALMSIRRAQTSFSEFIRSPHLKDWNGFTPMRPQLCSPEGELLVDEVVRIEEIGHRWPEVCARLGVGELALGRDNASRGERKDFREYYRDQADVELVRDTFAGDFESFGYPDAP